MLANRKLNVAHTLQDTTPWRGCFAFDVGGRVPDDLVEAAGRLHEARHSRAVFEDYEA